MNDAQLGIFASVKKIMRSRANMLFAFTTSAAMGTLIAGKGFPSMTPTILAIVSTFFITLSVYLYNDVIDLDMDKYSKISVKQARPLVSGEVSVKNASIIIVTSSILGIALAWLINPITFGFALLYWVLFILYSYPMVRLKRFFVIKSLITSLGPALTLLLGMSAILGGVYALGIFTALIQWGFLFLILPSLSDSLDMEEDLKYGMRTMGIVFSWKTKARMLMLAPILATIGSILAYFVFNLSPVFPALSAISTFFYGSVVYKILNEYDEETVWNLRKYSFIYYDLNLIYLLLGSLNIGSLLALI